MAGLTCLAELKGKSLPKSGESIDLATEMASALSGSTITIASLARDSDDTGTSNAVYKVNVVGKVGTTEVDLTLKHSPSADGSYKGRIFGTVAMNTTTYRGFSVVYDLTGTTLRYLAKSAVTKQTDGKTNLFDTDGNYKFTTFLAGFRADHKLVENSGTLWSKFLLKNAAYPTSQDKDPRF